MNLAVFADRSCDAPKNPRTVNLQNAPVVLFACAQNAVGCFEHAAQPALTHLVDLRCVENKSLTIRGSEDAHVHDRSVRS